MPYRNTADENEPSKRYFNPASCDVRRRRSKAASTYSEIERISSERKTVMRSFAETINIMPVAEHNIRAKYSGASRRSRCKYPDDTSRPRRVAPRMTVCTNTAKPSTATIPRNASYGPSSWTNPHWIAVKTADTATPAIAMTSAEPGTRG